MAFESDGLQRIGGANSDSRAVWVYAAVEEADNYAAISASDFFIDRIDELKLGDLMFVIDNGGVATLSYVLTNDGSTIQIAPGNTIAAA